MGLKTVLHPNHVALGARMVPFGGWDMPVQYGSILAEVKAVRTEVGIFDVFAHGAGLHFGAAGGGVPGLGVDRAGVGAAGGAGQILHDLQSRRRGD